MSEQIDLEEAIAKAPPRKHARWWPRHKFAEIDIGDGSRLRGDFVSSHRGELVRLSHMVPAGSGEWRQVGESKSMPTRVFEQLVTEFIGWSDGTDTKS
jgi:hypothetical protein